MPHMSQQIYVPILQAKAVSKKYKPDIVLYVDRSDLLRRPGSDLPVLRQITSVLGAGTWFNTVSFVKHRWPLTTTTGSLPHSLPTNGCTAYIYAEGCLLMRSAIAVQVLVMTHAAKPPPDGPAGPMAYDTYINHRMNALQQGVR